jgi:hypothetical protein
MIRFRRDIEGSAMTRTITKQEAAEAFDELIGSLSNDKETIVVSDK